MHYLKLSFAKRLRGRTIAQVSVQKRTRTLGHQAWVGHPWTFDGRFQKRSLRVAGYRFAVRVILPADSSSLRSQVRQPALEMVMVCRPWATSICEGVRPTKFPSIETSAPEGSDVISNWAVVGFEGTA